MALKLRQGLSTDRTTITPESGELLYTTDTKAVYVGDGATAGGNVLGSGGGGGSGTVTSIGGTGTISGISLSGTVTTSGNLTLGGTLSVTPSNFASQTANTVLSAPNGTNGTPTFRAIAVADIPTLNQNTTGTASNVTGTVAVANGGTGTATPALVAGTNVTITGTWPNQTIAASGGGGSGTVTSVDATVPAFLSVSGGPITTSGTLAISYSGTALPIANGGTGATTQQAAINALAGSVQNSRFLAGNGVNVTMRSIAVVDVPTLNQDTTGTAANVTGTVAIANGGTGQTTAGAAFNALSPVTTAGDLIIGNGTNSATRLAIGTSTYVLTSNGTTATWAAPSGGSGITTGKSIAMAMIFGY